MCVGQISSQVDIDVGGSGKPDFTFEPFGGVAALCGTVKDKVHPEHC